ncbi:hypothetical protein [Streptomyces sp. NBC_01353]|uniref:hypothetical protein n=1 Tax=Streptomyces sp. NBC_01353 TaxID=2903835 RepID=UPI002E315CBF|nr:hypothetical protein [Streptomyces sp. NBC_01353]
MPANESRVTTSVEAAVVSSQTVRCPSPSCGDSCIPARLVRRAILPGGRRAEPPAPLEVLLEERDQRRQQPAAVHHERHRLLRLVALGIQRKQRALPVHDDQLDRQLVGDRDLLAVRGELREPLRGMGVLQPGTRHDGLHGQAPPHRVPLDLVEVVLEGDDSGRRHRRDQRADLVPRLALHRDEPAPDRGRPGEDLDGRAGAPGVGGAVPLGEFGDEVLDAVQCRTPGLQERAEREDGGGRPVPDVVPVPLGAGEPTLDEPGEGAQDRLRVRRGVAESGGIAVRPVHKQPVDAVLFGVETEQCEQRRTLGNRLHPYPTPLCHPTRGGQGNGAPGADTITALVARGREGP